VSRAFARHSEKIASASDGGSGLAGADGMVRASTEGPMCRRRAHKRGGGRAAAGLKLLRGVE
jgi:hypothetical protein